MKTERRHELQHNQLADWLNVGVDKTKPYAQTILLAILGGVVLIGGVLFFSSRRQSKLAEAWDAYYVANDAEAGPDQEKLLAVAEDYPSSAAADWAFLAAADEDFMQGMNLLFSSRVASRAHLNKAKKAYRELREFTNISFVKQRATFSLAQTYEALSELDKAKEEYLAVEGVLAEAAQARAKDLETNPEAAKFYEWFAKAEPPKPAAPFDPAAPFGPQDDPSKLFDLDEPEDSPLRMLDEMDKLDSSRNDIPSSLNGPSLPPPTPNTPSRYGEPEQPAPKQPAVEPGDDPTPDSSAKEHEEEEKVSPAGSPATSEESGGEAGDKSSSARGDGEAGDDKNSSAGGEGKKPAEGEATSGDEPSSDGPSFNGADE